MKVIAVNFFCLVIILQVKAQQWAVTNVPHGREITSVHIFNHNNIAVAGGNPTNDALQSVFLSNNSGLTWDVNHDYVAPMINSMDFFDDSTGFAVGNEGILLKSSNGGHSWTSVSSGISRQLNDVKYLNDSTLIAVGGNGSYQTIIMSTDSGNNWTVQRDIPGGKLNAVFFTDLQHGVAVGINTILITADGGLNWTPVAAPLIRDFNSVMFAGSSIGYIAGGDTAGTVNRTILKTINGGNSWTVIADENAAPFHAVFFLNPDTGYVAGDSSKVFKTTDGGNNWISQSLNTTADSLRLNCIEFLNDSFGVIGSRFGNVFIYSNISLPLATSTGAVITNLVNATLGAVINGNGNEFVYTFLFDTDSNLLNASETFEIPATTSEPTAFSAYIPNLVNDTVYYYCVKARNLAGTVYGDTVVFYTGTLYNSFTTLPASLITPASARLNAQVGGLIYATTLEFEYGLTGVFGNAVATLPAVVSDTLSHQLYADISALQQNSFYYFRLKGTLPNGAAIYGQTLYFYNGDNTIPNWDFQLWNEDTIPVLAGWNFYGNGFEQAAGYTGNYALKIDDYSIAFLGELANNEAEGTPDFIAGIPFAYRPDSVIFYLNYFIETDDTALFLVKLYSGTNTISYNFFPITGNSSNQFQRIAYEIIYNNADMPDSLIFGMVSSNPFDTVRSLGSPNYLIIDDISFGISAPPVFNGDFENWSVYTAPRLVSWGPQNFYADTLIEPLITKTFYEQPGDFAAKIKTRMSDSGALFAPVLTTCSNLFNENIPNFNVNQRHITLNGYYQYHPENNDTMEVQVTMYKNGLRIGTGTFNQPEPVTEFTPLNVNINYEYPLLIPDSASINISPFSRNPKGKSYVVIDKLQFDNPVLPVSMEQTDNSGLQVIIYPNPGNDQLNLFMPGCKEHFTLEVFSVAGTQVFNQTFPATESMTINTAFLSNGIYFVNITSTEKVNTLKWIKK